MEIVVNEWLLDYMAPDAESRQTSMAIQFLNALVKKCDRIVIGRNTPFVSKFYDYMKHYGWNLDFKKRFRKLNHLLFYNPEKTVIVEEDERKNLLTEIEEKVPPDDKYLIELANFSKDKTIVTTDQRLKTKLQDEVDFKVCLLEDFLGGYLS